MTEPRDRHLKPLTPKQLDRLKAEYQRTTGRDAELLRRVE